MDLDAYVAAHLPQWRRLETLIRKRRLSSAEADEVLDLYQRTATHLSAVRSAAPEPELVAYLSWLLSRSRGHAAHAEGPGWRGVVAFFTDTFPALLYRTRRWWGITAAANLVVAALLTWWFLENPQVEQSLLTPGQVDQLVNHDFAHYYSQSAAASFSFKVWTNNAWVAALCIALGILGLPVLQVLYANILNLAIVASIMIRHGRADVFFGLILPHGLLELTCVFMAAGLGLRVFWAWVDPGDRTRGRALGEEGRAAVTGALGLGLALLVSGVIEGFVTPSPLPTAARVGIGILVEAVLLAYVFTFGRWAFYRGQTGDLAVEDAGYVAPARG